jgi:hypothetical protein
MPIPVICPGCKAQFRVSDKFAGQTGPCPKCKAPIKIPKAGPEVKIHAPEATEPKDSKGRVISKPIPRFEEAVSRRTMILIGAGTLATLAMAWFLGRAMENKLLLATVGTPLVALPLVVGGYHFLHEEEAEPYRGAALWIRSGICAAIYSILWGVFYFVPQDWFVAYWSWFYIAIPFLAAGAVTAFACLDLEFGNGFFHYSFFLVGTILLRSLIGMPALWTMTGS